MAVALAASALLISVPFLSSPAYSVKSGAKPGQGTCQIVPETFADGNVGALNTWFFGTTGCQTSQKPVRFRVVDGRLPDGLKLFTQGVGSGGITGVPEEEGVFAFTIEVRDATGSRDTESFTITIAPALPLVVTTTALSAGVVGEFYCCGNLFASGGVPGYSWSLVEGELPPGLELTSSPGSITGTPTTAGTFVFTVRVTDDAGTTADATLSITTG